MRRTHAERAGRFDYGMELVMDLEGCKREVIADGEKLKRYVKELVDLIKMKEYGPPWIKHFGHASAVTSGFTVIQPIETSSVGVHVSEGLDSVHVNVFTCLRLDPEVAMDFSEKFFGARDLTYTVLDR